MNKPRRSAKELRHDAEEGAKKDLKKPVWHLVADIHEQHEKAADDRYAQQRGEKRQHDALELDLHVAKRSASLTGVIALSGRRLSWAAVLIALASLVIAILALVMQFNPSSRSGGSAQAPAHAPAP